MAGGGLTKDKGETGQEECVRVCLCVCTHVLGMLVSTNLHKREEGFVIKIKVTERKKHNVGGVTPAGGRAFRQPQSPSAGSPITAREHLRARKSAGKIHPASGSGRWQAPPILSQWRCRDPPRLSAMTSLSPSAPPNEVSFEATGTKAGQELKPLLDHAPHFKLQKAGFQGYDRILIRNLLTANMTVKDTNYFKAASHHQMLVSL